MSDQIWIKPDQIHALHQSLEALLRQFKVLDPFSIDALKEHENRILGLGCQKPDVLLSLISKLVTETSQKFGAQIKLTHQGFERFWLDQISLNLLRRALVHIVRNSLSHGLVLQINGRPRSSPASLINLQINWKNNLLLVSATDSGEGPDFQKIKQRAQSLGLIKGGDQEWDSFSDEKKLSFIFNEGFSTTEKPTLMSGRGVGLSAVRAEVESFGGQIWAQKSTAGFKVCLAFLPRVLGVVLDIQELPRWYLQAVNPMGTFDALGSKMMSRNWSKGLDVWEELPSDLD